MKLSEELSNLISKLATLPEALDYLCDTIEALEEELSIERELRQSIALEKLQLQEQINKLQKDMLDMMKAEQANVHLSEIKNRAKFMSEKLQVSELVVWGCYADACRKVVVLVEPLPEPTEPLDGQEQKKVCVPKLGRKYKDIEGNVWNCHMVKDGKVGLDKELFAGHRVEWTMTLSEFQSRFEKYGL